MSLVSLDDAVRHCHAIPGQDDDLIQIYLNAAIQAAKDYLDRPIYATQQDMEDAQDTIGVVMNDAIRAAILLRCGSLYANREDVVVGVSAVALPMASIDLLRPHRRFGDVQQ